MDRVTHVASAPKLCSPGRHSGVGCRNTVSRVNWLRVGTGVQRCMKSVSGHCSLAAISSYIVAPSMDSRMMSAWPACRVNSSMRCSATQRTVQWSMSCGNHGTSWGTGTACIQVDLGEDPQRLVVLLAQLVEQLLEGLVVAHHVLIVRTRP